MPIWRVRFYQKVKRILGIRLYLITWQNYFTTAPRIKQSLFLSWNDKK